MNHYRMLLSLALCAGATSVLSIAAMGLEAPPVGLGQWGSAGVSPGSFNYPGAVAVDPSGYLYVTELGNHRVQKFSSMGAPVTSWGSFGEGNGQFRRPYGIAVDGNGNVYVADLDNHRVQKFSSGGEHILSWGSFGVGTGQFRYPAFVAADAAGHIYVTDHANHRVQVFTAEGAFITSWGTNPHPYGIALDPSNHVLTVTDDGAVQAFSTSGVLLDSWSAPTSASVGARGIATDIAGNIYIAGSVSHLIYKFSASGQLLVSWGGLGSTLGRMSAPHDVAVDAAGTIFVVDSFNNRIQYFGPGATSGIRSSWTQIKKLYR